MSDDLTKILATVEIPEELDAEEAVRDLRKHLIEIIPSNSGSHPPELVFMNTNELGAVTLATSLKIQNLKFYFDEFLMETLESAVAFSGALDKPLALILVALRFLQKVKQLATVEIGQAEAELLLTIYKLSKEDKKVTIDAIIEVMQDEQSPAQISESLHMLENLACIKLTMDELELNETIFIQREKQDMSGD